MKILGKFWKKYCQHILFKFITKYKTGPIPWYLNIYFRRKRVFRWQHFRCDISKVRQHVVGSQGTLWHGLLARALPKLHQQRWAGDGRGSLSLSLSPSQLVTLKYAHKDDDTSIIFACGRYGWTGRPLSIIRLGDKQTGTLCLTIFFSCWIYRRVIFLARENCCIHFAPSDCVGRTLVAQLVKVD